MKDPSSPKPFDKWLANHADKDTPVGQMARDWLADRGTCTAAQRFPNEDPGYCCADYLLGAWWAHGGAERVATLGQAMASYSCYLKRWAARRAAWVSAVAR